jgi:hypothetical protein
MKIKNFYDEGVTVTFPEKKNGKEVFVEKKPDIPVPSSDFDFIDVVMNIAFYVMKNDKKKYVGGLKPKAIIRIRYDEKVVKKAQDKGKTEDDLIFGWWDGSKWVYDKEDKAEKSNHKFKDKDWLGYGDLKTSGWDKDPPVGWGC